MNYTELAEELFRLKTLEYERGSRTRINYVSTGEDGVLYRLYQEGSSGVLAGDLARGMGLTSGRIANILKQLETKEYIVRTSGHHDRRQVIVTLTDAGRAHIEDAYQGNIQEIETCLEMLGEKDAGEYVRILGRLLEAGGTD